MKKKSELIIERIIKQQELEKHTKEEQAFINLLKQLGVNIIETNECIMPNALKELLIKEAIGEQE